MRKKHLDRDIVVLLVTSLITVATWVGLEVYRAYFVNNIPEGVEKHLTSIDPTLDVRVLDSLELKLQ